MDKNKIEKMEISPSNLRASFVPDSFNEEERSVEVVWTTGLKVKRWSWSRGEYFLEELSLKKDHVNLERLNLGAPVLNNHSSHSLESSIGVVEKAWISKGEGRALLRLSGRDDVKGIVQDIRDGIIRNISVGYTVETFEDVTKKKDEITTLRATSWTPMEVSFVNIPADQNSQVRSEEIENKDNKRTYQTNVIVRQEDVMDIETKKAAEPVVIVERKITEPVVVDAPTVDVEKERSEAKAEGMKEENERQTEIRSLVDSVKLDASVAADLIKENVSVDDARKQVIAKLAEKNEETNTVQNIEVNDTNNTELRKAATINAIEHMYAPINKPALIDGARDFAGQDMIEVAKNFMRSEGLKVDSMSREEIVSLALTGKSESYGRSNATTDFPFLVADVTNKSLQRAYGERGQTFADFTRSRTVTDFKTIQSTQFGDAPVLLEVNEKGEYKEGTMSENKEAYAIAKYGRIISFTERMLLNDDMGALLGVAEKFGRRARDLESDLVWKIITSNPVMNDTFALFSAEHGNIGTGIISVDNVNAGKVKMRAQLGLDGAKLDLQPKRLVVPSALETKAMQFLGTTTPNDDGQVNPFKTSLSPLSEIRLDDDSALKWYLFATMEQLEMIEIARLRGQESPSISTKISFSDDAMKMKIKYHFAAQVLDHRGFYRSTGA